MLKFTLIVLLILCSGISSTAQDTLLIKRVGDSLIAAKQFDVLILYLNKENTKFPKNENILRWLGFVNLHKGNLEETVNYYQEVLLLNPNCSTCYMNIAQTFYIKEDWVNTLKYLDKAIFLDKKNASYYSFRGEIRDLSNNKFGALEDYKKSVSLNPTSGQMYARRGKFNEKHGYYLLALDDYNRSVELSPKKYQVFHTRSLYFFRRSEYSKALKDINFAINLNLKNEELYLARATIYISLNQYEYALEDYKLVLNLNPTNYEVYYNRGHLYHLLENMNASCSDFNTLQKFINKGKIENKLIIKEVKLIISEYCDIQKPSYYYQRGIACYNLKKYKDALNFYRKGLEKFPINILLLSFNGNALMALNKYEKAIKNYNLSINKFSNPLNIKLLDSYFENKDQQNLFLHSNYLSLSECYNFIGNSTMALINIKKSIALLSFIEDLNIHASTYNTSGIINLQAARKKHALLDFSKSIDLDPNASLPYVNRAITSVSLSENIRTNFLDLKAEYKNIPIHFYWILPTNQNKENFSTALSDCDKAIEIDKLPYAYYIRGQIKKIINEEYCSDLLKAQQYGFPVETQLLKNCE